MRNISKVIVATASAGILGVAWQIGNTTSDINTYISSTPTPTITESPTTPEPSSTETTTPTPEPTSTSTVTPTSTPKPTTPSTPKPVTSKTVTGDAIQYRYGTVQVKAVESSAGKITDIQLVQASASGGRQQVFPSLVSAALQSQGVSFGNLSGATFSTDAFKQALSSALNKF